MRAQQLTNVLSPLILGLLVSSCAGTTDDASASNNNSQTAISLTVEDVTPSPEETPAETPVETPVNIPADADASITAGMIWAYFKGTESPGSEWNTLNYDDSNWLTGASGFGYADNDDATVLSDMSGNYNTVYTRKTFFHESATTITKLTLSIDYDDGYIAYLNGVEVSRSSNMPAGSATFSTLATNTHEAGTAVNIDLSAYIDDLNVGDNVLSVEVHNQSANSSDLSLITSLYINEDAPVSPSAPESPSTGGGSGSTVPDGTFGTLSNYTNVEAERTLSYANDDLSGITYNPVTDTYFMIQNNGGRIWEVDKNFNLLRVIRMLNNSFDDSEDIVYMGNSEYAIVNEASQLFIVSIFSDTTTLDAADTSTVQTIRFGSDGGNIGPEGVAFDQATQTFYIVKEMQPKAIYSFQRPAAGNQSIVPDEPFDAETVFANVLGTYGDLSAITFDHRDNTLLILSHTRHQVLNVDITGNVLGVLELSDNRQAEGITLDENGSIQIVSEANFQRTYNMAP